MERKLAAIFALDMVSFSRLMGADETGTLSRHQSHIRELLEPTITAHNGHIVKGTGDGLLVEFASAVDAVEAAAEIQRQMPARDEGVPDERRIVYRIGINVGDIVVEDGDIYGDGVNVAARIEALAEPGTVYISGSAYNQVKNKVQLGFADLGRHEVKNIEEPVRVYEVLLDPALAGTLPGRKRRRKKISKEMLAAAIVIVVLGGGFAIRDFVMRDTTRRDARATRASALEQLSETEDPRRIAVLYFEPRSPQEEVPYLAAGLTETLITELGTVPALTVTSRNGSAMFRGEVVPADSISRALKVGTLVDGTVALSDERIRVNVSFVNAETGESFGRTLVERPRAELFELQDDLAKEVAAFLRERLGEEVELIERSAAAAENVEAWELMQRARSLSDQADELAAAGDTDGAWERLGEADSVLALAEYVSPEWVEPTIRRGWIAYWRARWRGVSQPELGEPWVASGLELAEVALRLEPGNADALALRGCLEHWQWAVDLVPDPEASDALLEQAEADLRAAVAEDPSQAIAWAMLSHLMLARGKTAEGNMAAQRAFEADAYLRNVDTILWRLFTTSYDLQAPRDAERWCRELGRRAPNDDRFPECRLWLMTMDGTEANADSAWVMAGEYQRLRSPETAEFDRRWSGMAVAAVLARAGLADSARHVAEASRGNSTVDPIKDLVYVEAFVRTLLGDNEEAIDLLAEYLAVAGKTPDEIDHWWFEALDDEPRYRTLRGS